MRPRYIPIQSYSVFKERPAPVERAGDFYHPNHARRLRRVRQVDPKNRSRCAKNPARICPAERQARKQILRWQQIRANPNRKYYRQGMD